MNLFEQPEAVVFDESGLSLPRLNGLTWIEKDWLYREEAELNLQAVVHLNKCTEEIAEVSEKSVEEVERLLKLPNMRGVAELDQHFDVIVEMQKKRSVAQLNADYRLVGMILSSRLEDTWLKSQVGNIKEFYLSDYEPWKNANTEVIWSKLNCKKELKTSDPFRVESLIEFAKSIPPGLFIKLYEFCDQELSPADATNGKSPKKNSPLSKSSNLSEKKPKSSPSAA